MTIEEAIKQIDDKALQCEAESKMWYEALEFIEQKDVAETYKKNGDYWIEQATDRYQLAEWLKELKAHREAWEKVRKGLIDKHRDSYFIGVYDAMKIVDKYRPKEGENK